MLPLVSKNHSRICSHHLDGSRLFLPWWNKIKVVAKYHLFYELSGKAHSTCFVAFIEAFGRFENYPPILINKLVPKPVPCRYFRGSNSALKHSAEAVLSKDVAAKCLRRAWGSFWNFEGKRTLSFHQARSIMVATHCPAFASICPQHREPSRLSYFTFWWTICVSSSYGSVEKRTGYQENSVPLMQTHLSIWD